MRTEVPGVLEHERTAAVIVWQFVDSTDRPLDEYAKTASTDRESVHIHKGDSLNHPSLPVCESQTFHGFRLPIFRIKDMICSNVKTHSVIV
jgi:hypothetical protein